MKEFNDRFYPETVGNEKPVLKNKLNIRNLKELEETELELTIAKTYLINKNSIPGDWDLKHLMDYHKYMFEELYDWAGKLREFDVVKYEEVLSGASVNYVTPLLIAPRIKNTLEVINKRDISKMDSKSQVNLFCDALVDVWQSHPFNEGNTRTTSIFMRQFTIENNIPVNFKKLFQDPCSLRNSFVVFATGYNDKIMNDLFLDSMV